MRVLLVEDSPTDAKLVRRALEHATESVELERVDTREAMHAALTQKRWDVVVSDWSMPRFSARAALDLLKELNLDIPFVIVSGTIGEEIAVEAMRAGAHDYVLKDKLSRLAPAVEREIREAKNREARRQANDALLASEARYRRIVETTNQGVVLTDVSGRTTFVNGRMAEMLGVSREAAQGVFILDFVARERRDEAERDLLRSREGAIQFETTLLRAGGAKVVALVDASPMYRTSGEYEGSFAMVMDVTQRRDLEAQLRQAQKMEAVGRLAGGIAHDFNNVLSVILSCSEIMLADLRPGDPLRDDVKEIHTAGTRAAELTRQLLMFSRQKVIEPRVVDLNGVLASMNKMLRRIVGEDVELVSVAGESLGHVRVDPGSIEQVIMNLAVNARDAMPEGGKLMMETANVVLDDDYAKSHVGAKPGAYVMLSVTDTGVGMDKATLGRIFEPFFTTKEKGRGTGLGLSTVFGIVQQSGGYIWVDSAPEVGTKFEIYLPRVDASADASRPQKVSTTLRGSETILLVEDEEQVRSVARGILRRHGYTVLEARNAGEALLVCESHDGPLHLLLTDVVMPQMSGPELANRLRQLRPNLKVLCMSGYADDEAVHHGVRDASFAYLQKPITVDALTRKVRNLLDS
jgi:two-component system, cell cycle sensor histidine kinase and response regulator CckA